MKKYNLFAITVLIILGTAFYWYEYRPTKIKTSCSAEARFDTRAISESDDLKRQEFINMYYEDCLMRFGLK